MESERTEVFAPTDYRRVRESGASGTPPPTDELQVVRWGGTM